MKVRFIDLFPIEVWQYASVSVKKSALRQITLTIAENLQLKRCPNLRYIFSPPVQNADGSYSVEYGKYLAKNNTVLLNTYYLNDSYALIETIAHELRHAWQYQISRLRNSRQSVIMANNFMNYVQFSEDSKQYGYQPLERDARQYAKEVRETVESLSR